MYKLGKIPAEDYISKTKSSFYIFLVEFRVVRNFASGQVSKVLKETMDLIRSCDCNDVEGFALTLSRTSLTRNSILASNILFLNNSYEIISMDSLARKSLQQSKNIYNVYRNNLESFKRQNYLLVMEMLDYLKPLSGTFYTLIKF